MSKKTSKTTKAKIKRKASSSKKGEILEKLVKEPTTKKIAAKPEAKKITTAKEPAKIAAAKEPEKITTAKEPEKITATPEPKKIMVKELKKIDTKKSDSSPIKEVAATSKDDTKLEVKKKSTKKDEKATAKSVQQKVDNEASVRKSTSTTSKKENNATKKATPKKVASKKDKETAQQIKYYEGLSLDACMQYMRAMGVMHTYDDYKRFLLDEANMDVIEKNIIAGNDLERKGYTFEKDGFDTKLIKVTLQKVGDTMDVKASDFPSIKKDMRAELKTSMVADEDKNAKEYLKEFKTAEKILMIAQRKNMSDSTQLSALLGSDISPFLNHFFTCAYEILPTWQYEDVKFYEDFAFAILSQFIDIYEKQQLRILIDCADLYIKHGDFKHGDESYGYILRDNEIKDYIYYRFASVYTDIDMEKAKKLAYESLQYVDDRFQYYPSIIEIMNA